MTIEIEPPPQSKPSSGWGGILKSVGAGCLAIFCFGSLESDRDTSQIPARPSPRKLGDQELSGLNLKGEVCSFLVPGEAYLRGQQVLSYHASLAFGLGIEGKLQRLATSDEKLLGYIAETLTEGAESTEQKILHIHRWVQAAIGYDSIEGGSLLQGGYLRHPLETLYEKRGDCEDLACLYAALYRSIGIDVAILQYRGHIALGICGDFPDSDGCFEADGKRYHYLETTCEDFRPGEIPERFKGVEPKVIKLS